MRGIVLWVGVALALAVLLFHFIHLATEYELVMLEISVVLIGLGVAPFPAR